ncbi:hypothetical protein MNBD_CHLOROFLEXI01-5041, partial [hydrothermal vent metagenome]
MVVGDKEYFAFTVFYHPFQKDLEHLAVEARPHEHELQVPPVAYGRYHIDRKAFPRCHGDGRPSLGRIAPSRLVVALAARLVPEIDDGLFQLRPSLYGGIFLLQPLFYRFRLLLESLFNGLLGGVPPFFRITPYLPTGELHTVPRRYELLYRFPCPQPEGQFQLVGHFFPYQPAKLVRLPLFKLRAALGAPLLAPKGLFAAYLVLCPYPVHRHLAQAEYGGAFLLRALLLPQVIGDPETDQLLGLLTMPFLVFSLHPIKIGL